MYGMPVFRVNLNHATMIGCVEAKRDKGPFQSTYEASVSTPSFHLTGRQQDSTTPAERSLARHAWPWAILAALIGVSIVLWTFQSTSPTLTATQEVVKREILGRSNKPERVRFERWYPEIENTSGLAYAGNGKQEVPCDHLVRLIRRETQPFLGEMRYDIIYYVNKNEIAWSCSRSGDSTEFNEITNRYYANDK
jgi:hypothetical protein